MLELDHLRAAITTCSLPSALEAMGERWSFLILRGAFNGLRHFEQFQGTLGIARNILANRLGRLVDHGILARQPCTDDRRKVEYRLTQKGADLLPTLIALRQWGDKWGDQGPSNPVLVDDRDGRPVADVLVHAADGRPLRLGELRWVTRAQLG